MSKETNAAAMLGTASASVEISGGLVVEFRPPKLKDLIELEKKLGRPALQSMDLLETQTMLVAKLGSIGGVPVRVESIESTWGIDDLGKCLEALAPLFQRLTSGASSSSPAGSSGAASAPTS